MSDTSATITALNGGNTDTPLTYRQADTELNELVRRLESGQLDVDEVADTVERAQFLLQFMADLLAGAETRIRQLTDSGVTDVARAS
jgi:exodeoxyribonuclease VII small subunit